MDPDRFGAEAQATLGISYTVLYGNSGISKNKGTSFWNLDQTLELANHVFNRIICCG